MFTIEKNKIQYITKLNKQMLDISFSNDILKGKGLEDFKRVNCNFNQYYYFKNNNANILAVAHLDTVQTDDWYYVQDNRLFSPLVDDRIGVYVLLYLLSNLDCNFDILLTTGEETFNSTAQFFHTDKQYNWMFSFDRMSNDVVTYHYNNEQIVNDFNQLDIHNGIGSYSDICDLNHLNCFGMNFGAGYYNGHSLSGYVDLRMLMSQVLKFKKIYNIYKDIYLPNEKKIYNWVEKTDKYNLFEYNYI